MATYIAGGIFIALSIAWYFIQANDASKKKREQVIKDGKKAIDDHDVDALLDAERRLRNP